ncbi:DUF402 domain-containing protein [uncultured Corynebacterium sp.]|uniref:DUF402 domain-containing protein n=1 Tax=uncultured Corynebacterium sp. TaxID=159447 RepID=UPI0025DF6F89|nr:DUF402 domain-containing protein [uncultured Corynebacterium sp.]
MHSPKQETFDVDARINIDPKGFDRAVDTYAVTEFGLYMARGANHPRFGYLESWLLPEVGLRVNKFHVRDVGTGAVSEYQEYYTDIARIERAATRWTTTDLYVDLLSTTGQPVDVDDIDELSQAAAEALIPAEDVEFAIEATLRAVEGITRHGDDVMAWLDSLGMHLTWAENVTLMPAS